MTGAGPQAGETVPAPSGEVLTVVIVDDHELLRMGTRRILEDDKGFVVVGEAGEGDEALALVDRQRPDIVLVDIRLPTTNGIELGRQIVTLYPRTTVVILSAYDDDHYVQAALAVGLSGYLLKTTPGHQLVRSIRAAHRGEPVFDVARPVATVGGPVLTAREEEVVHLAVRGLANKAIARRLGISPRTVEGHLNHVFEKLGASSRTELVHMVMTRGLLEGPPPPGGQA